MTTATTLQQALHPLLVASTVIGLGVYTRKPRPCLNVLCSLIAWTAYVCLCSYVTIALDMGNWFSAMSAIANMAMNFAITITSVFMTLRCDERFRIFVKRLNAVDDTLEELGTTKTYRKLQMWVKRVIVGWVVHCCVMNTNDALWCYFMMEDRRVMILPYITNYYRHVNTYMELLFMILVWHIGTRFDEVNEHMRCLLVKEEHGLRRIWVNAAPSTRRYIMRTDNHKHVLWTSMHLHLELSRLAREANEMYGIQLTLEMACQLIFIMASSYYFYICLRTLDKYIVIQSFFCICLWAFSSAAKIFCLNYICETVSAKANEMKRAIHQLSDSVRYDDIHDEIYQFTLQLIRHPLKFTGMGFFYFGNGFLRKFFLIAIGYVIIVVQITSSTPNTVL